ncbi:hypothetical protein PVAP13_9NG472800 [Panicum virgatum]|uniref:Probable quinone oxidoreductase n=1 Tax=Panicum virgatum TaxID=38727 RepID=A0A8T0MTB0_PANVG|nr:hypothetical protein PVAP13_9NG472800 [Panicum virgatum]
MWVKVIKVHELGGPEVLSWEEVEIGDPKEGEIRIKNKAGVNYVDIYYRTGLHRAPLPFIPGKEAVGVVSAVGPGVTSFKVGDVVSYADNPMGSYAEEQIIPASVAIPIPPAIDYKTAASVLLKGMTAYVLVRQAFKRGHTVLVHAAAAGVGSLLCQWANALGATVIGTVSTEEKVGQATQDGCRHVIVYTKEDFVTRVAEITSGEGVHVVYDAVGKDTFQGSLACLMSRGCMISYGQSSGSRPDPVRLSDLAPKSLILGRPGLMHYTTNHDELLQAASEVFASIMAGVLQVHSNHVYLLSEAARVHKDLEARRTSGSIVLIPDGQRL